MNNLILILSISTAASAAGFVLFAVLWLKKLRETINNAMSETATQQILAAQNLGDSVAKIKKQLRIHEQQFQTLALSHTRMKSDMESIANRLELEIAEVEEPTPRRVTARTVH